MKFGQRRDVLVHYFGDRRPRREAASSRALTIFWGVLALAYAVLLLLVGGGADGIGGSGPGYGRTQSTPPARDAVPHESWVNRRRRRA